MQYQKPAQPAVRASAMLEPPEKGIELFFRVIKALCFEKTARFHDPTRDEILAPTTTSAWIYWNLTQLGNVFERIRYAQSV
ncbi:MAG: hypothetical protein WAU91_04750 [Desulfatitalea sp.]